MSSRDDSMRLLAFAGPMAWSTVLGACAAVSGLSAYSEADCSSGCEDATADVSPDVTVKDAPHTESQAIEDVAQDTVGQDGDDAGDGGLPTCSVPTDIDGGLLVYYPFEGSTADQSGNGDN